MEELAIMGELVQEMHRTADAMRAPHSSPCAKICGAITTDSTEWRRLIVDEAGA
jgi:hypothetical protein